MTIHEASQQLRFQLFHLYDEREAGNITDLIMENIAGWQKIDRIVNKTASLSLKQQQQLEEYKNALLKNKPLQYVLHEAWFYGMKLYVDENVLIPRPETEELVDWIIKEVFSLEFLVQSPVSRNNTVLDIGTGSGCIPLAIKKKLPAIKVHACDISESALNVARKNATEQNLHIHFHLLDILSESERNQLPMFDIIVSNPPYIPQSNKRAMAANVLEHEPHLALFVEDNDPLVFYRAIADFASSHLNKNGSLYLEIHEDLGTEVIALFTDASFGLAALRKDMQGKDRMVKVQWLNG